MFSGFLSSLLALTKRDTRALNTHATNCPSMPLEPAPPREAPKLVAYPPCWLSTPLLDPERFWPVAEASETVGIQKYMVHLN